MDFLEITELFERKISAEFGIDVLEFHYLPYAFGSGAKSYRINGRNIKINFDGRDRLVEVQISRRQEKYPSGHWATVFNGTIADFVDRGIVEVKKRIEL